jgi:hypothetical protein
MVFPHQSESTTTMDNVESDDLIGYKNKNCEKNAKKKRTITEGHTKTRLSQTHVNQVIYTCNHLKVSMVLVLGTVSKT